MLIMFKTAELVSNSRQVAGGTPISPKTRRKRSSSLHATGDAKASWTATGYHAVDTTRVWRDLCGRPPQFSVKTKIPTLRTEKVNLHRKTISKPTSFEICIQGSLPRELKFLAANNRVPNRAISSGVVAFLLYFFYLFSYLV